MNEKIIWESKPSLFYKWPLHLFLSVMIIGLVILNEYVEIYFHWLIFGVIFFLVLCITASILSIYCTTYKFSNQRIFIYSGIFSRSREEIELYRVKDYKIVSPFLYRIFLLSNIIIHTSDHSSPIVTLLAIKNAEKVTNSLRIFVEKNRTEKGVRQFDL